ncbi:hypothetical protein MLD38_037133 [Melastoma candidum]|uniref:Uncharacterized protein n=1 Tax=Melastoma candidum TaxID=119954 RepID=A0ACB9LN13_9MYRT|nr:hypothetical protein MLD38_037133 [Melastoma candidum]
MFEEMVYRGINPSLYTFTVLIDGLGKEGKIDEGRTEEANNVFVAMIEKGCSPDVVTLSNLMNGYIMEKNFGQVRLLFFEMLNRGLKPDCVTYTVLIRGLFLSGNARTALQLFYKIIAYGDTVDEKTYGIVVDGLCRCRRINEAFRLLRNLEMARLELDCEADKH